MKFSKVHVVSPGIDYGTGLESLFKSEGTAPRDGWTLEGHTAGILMKKGGKTYLVPWSRVSHAEIIPDPEKAKLS